MFEQLILSLQGWQNRLSAAAPFGVGHPPPFHLYAVLSMATAENETGANKLFFTAIQVFKGAEALPNRSAYDRKILVVYLCLFDIQMPKAFDALFSFLSAELLSFEEILLKLFSRSFYCLKIVCYLVFITAGYRYLMCMIFWALFVFLKLLHSNTSSRSMRT